MLQSELKNLFEQFQTICIFGAKMVAVRFYYALKSLYPNVQIMCFLVSMKEGNPSSIDGIPVIELQEFDSKDIPVFVATPEVIHAEIVRSLEEKNIKKVICLDSKKEAALLEVFFRDCTPFTTLRSCQKGEDRISLSAYMSKFYRDKVLAKSYIFPEWIHPIQVGSDLTDVRITELCDNEGDNISRKNPNYSELTASYWIGKHGTDEYLGLYHYRRILDVMEEDLQRICWNDIDVVLPYPSIHQPDIHAHHKRWLADSDWDALLQAIHEISPDYAKALPELFSGRYFYNYNILIAKRTIFQEYCNWMFPILARVEELSVPRGDERADRYIGYIGESLTTLYFLYNRDKYKIAVAGCHMLI
ncbi:MAG: DUF4422 domain-containing protein [Lachnospiraceae bacterium]|nr:DUF4422 domain-containing protein [Lachnospiraceae bacterium]